MRAIVLLVWGCCFLVLYLVAISECGFVVVPCGCFPKHPQTRVCEADEIVQGKVTKVEKLNTGNDWVTLKVKKNFRSGSPHKVGKSMNVFTCNSYVTCCGVSGIDKGETWLFTARYDTFLDPGFTNKITACGFNRKLNGLSKNKKKRFLKYPTVCNCKVLRCSGCESKTKFCRPSDKVPTNVCKYYANVYGNTCAGKCYEKFGICKKKDGKCKWTGQGLSGCLKKCAVGARSCPIITFSTG